MREYDYDVLGPTRSGGLEGVMGGIRFAILKDHLFLDVQPRPRPSQWNARFLVGPSGSSNLKMCPKARVLKTD